MRRLAATAPPLKKALQNNINISFQRGKKVQGPGGGTTYQLQDGFNVFDGIPNTPKYWKTFRHELMAKLDNVGPFHIFFTLSCADSLWQVCVIYKYFSYKMADFISLIFLTGKLCLNSEKIGR